MPDPKTTGEIHQVSVEIGQLKASLDYLNRSIENLNKTWGERELAATQGRRSLHDKLDAVVTRITHVEGKVEGFSRDLGEIWPEILSFRSRRDQQIGASSLGWKLWGAIVAAVGSMGWIAHQFFGGK